MGRSKCGSRSIHCYKDSKVRPSRPRDHIWRKRKEENELERMQVPLERSTTKRRGREESQEVAGSEIGGKKSNKRLQDRRETGNWIGRKSTLKKRYDTHNLSSWTSRP